MHHAGTGTFKHKMLVYKILFCYSIFVSSCAVGLKKVHATYCKYRKMFGNFNGIICVSLAYVLPHLDFVCLSVVRLKCDVCLSANNVNPDGFFGDTKLAN